MKPLYLIIVVMAFVFILDKYEDKNFTIINTENGSMAFFHFSTMALEVKKCMNILSMITA
jgi:hypothetical protein